MSLFSMTSPEPIAAAGRAAPARALRAARARPAAAGRPRDRCGKSRCARASPTAGWCRRPRASSRPWSSLRRPANCSATSLATVARVAAGFAFGVAAGTLARRDHRLFGADAPPARSDPAGAALDPVDRLGAAVHPVVRHLRSLEDHADRGRRVLPGLSRRDGRDAVGRPQDRRGRPRVPPVRRRDGAAHPAARGAAGLRDRAALRARARLDVRGRGRTARRLRRARLSAGRRPAARQAGADRRRHRRLRRDRQDHRLDLERGRGAVPALGRPLRERDS